MVGGHGPFATFVGVITRCLAKSTQGTGAGTGTTGTAFFFGMALAATISAFPNANCTNGLSETTADCLPINKTVPFGGVNRRLLGLGDGDTQSLIGFVIASQPSRQDNTNYI